MKEFELRPILRKSRRYQNIHHSSQRKHPRLQHSCPTKACKVAKNLLFVVHTSRNFTTLCPKVVNPAKRKEILQGKHQCFICLRVGHRGSECQTTKTCRHCNKRHHQSICDQGTPNQEISTTSIANDKSENSQVTTTAAL